MALVPNEYFSTVSRDGPASIIPHQGGVQPKTFAADPGATELAVGTPVAFDNVANYWVVWTNAGPNDTGTIRGFVYPQPIQLDAAGEVVGQVLLDGEILYDCIVLPAGELQANLDAALRDGPRGLGLKVDGLNGVR